MSWCESLNSLCRTLARKWSTLTLLVLELLVEVWVSPLPTYLSGTSFSVSQVNLDWKYAHTLSTAQVPWYCSYQRLPHYRCLWYPTWSRHSAFFQSSEVPPDTVFFGFSVFFPARYPTSFCMSWCEFRDSWFRTPARRCSTWASWVAVLLEVWASLLLTSLWGTSFDVLQELLG